MERHDTPPRPSLPQNYAPAVDRPELIVCGVTRNAGLANFGRAEPIEALSREQNRKANNSAHLHRRTIDIGQFRGRQNMPLPHPDRSHGTPNNSRFQGSHIRYSRGSGL